MHATHQRLGQQAYPPRSRIARPGRYDHVGRSHQCMDATPAMAAKGSNPSHDLDRIVERVAETQANPRRPKT